MDSTEKDLINFILEQSQKEISFEEHLERQKTLLLAQEEAKHWKRLVYETERFREQYLREDRLDLKQVFKLRNLFYRLNEPRLKIVIDQGLERWMNDEDDGENYYQQEIGQLRSRIDRMKQQSARYKDVFEKVQESKSHRMVQESSRKVREEQAKIEQSQKAIDELWKESSAQARKEWKEMKQMIVEFSKLCTGSNMMDIEKEATLRNNEIKRVKIVQLHEEIERARIEQEEEAKRREIELSERILIPIKITPMTLENTMFKNPNDFPALIDKIESTRKSYEQIFKRPEYMDMRKIRKKNKKSMTKSFNHFDLLFGGSKRKGKTRKSQLNPSAAVETVAKPVTAEISTKPVTAEGGVKPLTAETATKPVTIDEVATRPKKYQQKAVAKELPPVTKLAKSNAPVEIPTTKCLLQSDKDLSKSQPITVSNAKIPSKKPKRKASNDESFEDQRRPICNVQGQRIKQPPAQSMSQPELPAAPREKTKSEPPRKRPSLEKPVSASAPPQVQDHREFKKPQQIQEHSPEKASRKKSKKVAFKPQTELDGDSFSFSPEKPDRKTKPRSQQQPVEQPQDRIEVDRNSFSFSPEKSDRKTKPKSQQQPVKQPDNRSLSPPSPEQRNKPTPAAPLDFDPQEPAQQQTVEDDNFSFGSASPPMDARQSKDDGGSFFDTGSISSFDMEDRESGSDLGFDLSPVGPRSNQRRTEPGGESGSDGNTSDFDFLASPPKSGAAAAGSQGGGGRKGQDCFAFTDDDDSGTGFDFF